MPRFSRIVLLPLWLLALAAQAETRTWTLPGGRLIRADLVGIRDGKAVLLPPNGNVEVEVPTPALDPLDRAAVDAWVPAGRRGAGHNAEVQRNEAGWPLTVTLKEDPTVIIVEQDRAKRRFIYRSDHFEFTSTQRLNGKIVREFSRVFEVTYETVAALPLRIRPEPPRGYFKVLLYASERDYRAAGGPPGSGGLFRGSTGEVMVPLPNLGVKKAAGRWMMESRDGNQPLIHEVTHQVMGAWLSVLPVWMVEGSAEYLAAARYYTGKLTLHPNFDNMAAFLREYKGIDDRDIDMRHPMRLMTTDHEKWRRDLAGREGLKNYYSAMLLFYFFCHADSDGSGRGIIEYFKSRAASKSPYDDTADRDRCLLRGRSWDTLWDDVRRAFAVRKYRVS
jgi:hypothetical protein